MHLPLVSNVLYLKKLKPNKIYLRIINTREELLVGYSFRYPDVDLIENILTAEKLERLNPTVYLQLHPEKHVVNYVVAD